MSLRQREQRLTGHCMIYSILTLRERESMILRGAGVPHKVAAFRLGISRSTMSEYISFGLRKLGISRITKRGGKASRG